jgi:hypothetical protein
MARSLNCESLLIDLGAPLLWGAFLFACVRKIHLPKIMASNGLSRFPQRKMALLEERPMNFPGDVICMTNLPHHASPSSDLQERFCRGFANGPAACRASSHPKITMF